MWYLSRFYNSKQKNRSRSDNYRLSKKQKHVVTWCDKHKKKLFLSIGPKNVLPPIVFQTTTAKKSKSKLDVVHV